jgi:protein TonB
MEVNTMLDSLIVSKKTAIGKRKWFAIPVSVSLHLSVIGFFILSSIWAVGKTDRPSRGTVAANDQQQISRRCAPSIKAEAKKQSAAAETVAETPSAKPVKMIAEKRVEKPVERPPASRTAPVEQVASTTVAPSVIEPESPKVVETPSVETSPAAARVEQSIPAAGAGIETPVAALGESPASSAPADDDAATIYRIIGGVEKPEILESAGPGYPAVARNAKIQGSVVLEAVINKTGAVQDVTVLRSIPSLDQAAVDAVKQWKFKPARVNGKPVACYYSAKVKFMLGSK